MEILKLKRMAYLFVSIAALTSCTKQQFSDLYDPNHLQEQAKEAFPVKNIDPNQTWAMMSTRTVSVGVDGVAGTSYTLKVYSENPVFNSAAPLMAKTTATAGKTASFSFDSPTALERVFVSREGSDGRYVAVAELSGDKFVGSFDVSIASRAMSRAASIDTEMSKIIAEKVEIPTDEELAVLFPRTIPTEAKVISAGVDLNDKTTKLRLNGDNFNFNYWQNDNIVRELYVEENKSVTITGNLNTPIVIYLLPGATLTLDNYPYSTPLTICVGENATWNLSGAKTLQSNDKIKVYNKGIVKAANLTMNQNAELYNYGKLDVEQLTVNGGGSASVLYNDLEGIVNVGSVTLGGSGMYLYNIGTMTVIGSTSTSNSTGYWVNAGTYVTSSLSLSAHAKFFHNYCKLYVNDRIYVKDGTFNLKDNAYLEAAEIEFSNGLVELGANAVFYVKSKTVVHSNADGFLQGFYGLSKDKPALIKLGGQTVKAAGKDKKHMLSFSGNIRYAAEDMFEETTNTGNQPNVEIANGAKGVDYDQVILPTPTAEQCAPNWSINDGGGSTEDQPYLFTYAFEDMTKEVGDYDFNDVVLQVSSPIDGAIKIKLLAAGATKNLRVGFNNKLTSDDNLLFDGREVHDVLGSSAGKITNTVSMNGTIYEMTMSVDAAFSVRIHGDFYILDDTNAKIHIPEFTEGGFTPGFVPYAIRVPKDWAYPRERVSIVDAYPDFVYWAQDATALNHWYDNPVMENVFSIVK